MPALREHGDGDDAANRSAEGIGLADRVHDLAQQLLIGEVLGLLPVAGAGDDLAPEALDLVAGGVAEAPVEGLARVELLALDEQRARPGERVAVLVEVAEQRQAAILERRRAVLVLAVEAGDEVVDQARLDVQRCTIEPQARLHPKQRREHGLEIAAHLRPAERHERLADGRVEALLDHLRADAGVPVANPAE